jgi:hypothetical protein
MICTNGRMNDTPVQHVILYACMHVCVCVCVCMFAVYEGVSISFRTGRLERELQIVEFSVTRCSCIAIL